MSDIDKMTSAGVVPVNVKPASGDDVQVPETRTWWQKLFGVNRIQAGGARAS